MLEVTYHNNIIDFNKKAREREEKKKKEKMYDYFLKNIIPFMSPEEYESLSAALSSSSNEADQIWNKIIVSTSIRRAKAEL
ncbi:hypothetical protein [Bacillus sp. Au-Bac7]|uniref:hypothetical protein n=1 Tax=Bacillus sp. Au-Bac7 TaxID=2906458 RepID=UPI001E55CA98|nr:hypothetical protein [Bacillus sp. Au-Bac7]MCE4051856.1 hypothetical protein [Bacillus sp. Au-Bac7]